MDEIVLLLAKEIVKNQDYVAGDDEVTLPSALLEEFVLAAEDYFGPDELNDEE